MKHTGPILALLGFALLIVSLLPAPGRAEGSTLIEAIYLSSAPTLADRETAALRLNVSGGLVVDASGGSGGLGLGGTAASVDVNADIAADVDAAVAAATTLRLVGWSIKEDAATAAVATFRIIHGATVVGGTEVDTIELAPNESRSEWYLPGGIACPNGISIDRIAGTADVDLYYVQ